jgi:hypothetical protein
VAFSVLIVPLMVVLMVLMVPLLCTGGLGGCCASTVVEAGDTPGDAL